MYSMPDYVKFWLEHPGMPCCCFLCAHFDIKTGYCDKFKQIVPENFASKLDACNQFIDKDGIPF